MSFTIAIDARPLADPGGEAYAYTLNLVHALAFVDHQTRFHLLFDREVDPAGLPRAENVTAAVVSGRRAAWKFGPLAAAARAAGADLLHVQGLPPHRAGLPVSTTIRTLDPLDHPERYPRRTAWAWAHLLPRLLGEAAVVFCPWRGVAERVAGIAGCHWQLATGTPVVLHVPYGVEPAFRPQCEAVQSAARGHFRLPESYVLGRVHPRDGAEGLVAVYRLARERHGLAAGLVLDGPVDGWDGPFAPSLEPAPMSAVLSAAVATLLGGGEAGGLAMLESLACGTPAVAPGGEVFERDLGKLALCGTADEQAAELAAVERDPELRLKRMRGGLAATQALTWPAMAEQTLAAWRQVLSG